MSETDTNPSPALTNDERSLGTLAHILTLSGFLIPFGNVLAPLIIYVMKKDSSS